MGGPSALELGEGLPATNRKKLTRYELAYEASDLDRRQVLYRETGEERCMQSFCGET